MFEDEKDDKIYNLIISNGTDMKNEYGQFTEKLYSKVDFRWKESMSGAYTTAGEGFYRKCQEGRRHGLLHLGGR